MPPAGAKAWKRSWTCSSLFWTGISKAWPASRESISKTPPEKSIRTLPRRFLLDLDDYPFPSDSLDLFLDDIHDRDKNSRDLVYILAGAGCPHRCVFCAQHAIHRGRIRERSAENIFAEMKKLSEKGFRKFAIVQETFLRDPERVDRFCSLIEKFADAVGMDHRSPGRSADL